TKPGADAPGSGWHAPPAGLRGRYGWPSGPRGLQVRDPDLPVVHGHLNGAGAHVRVRVGHAVGHAAALVQPDDKDLGIGLLQDALFLDELAASTIGPQLDAPADIHLQVAPDIFEALAVGGHRSSPLSHSRTLCILPRFPVAVKKNSYYSRGREKLSRHVCKNRLVGPTWR